MVRYNLKHPPFSIVTATGLHWKSGVLFPSGMFTKYCVMITPEVLDLFRIAAKQNGGKNKKQLIVRINHEFAGFDWTKQISFLLPADVRNVKHFPSDN